MKGGWWTKLLEGGTAKEDEPVPAVVVCEGDAVGHFLDVGRGMVLIRDRLVSWLETGLDL